MIRLSALSVLCVLASALVSCSGGSSGATAGLPAPNEAAVHANGSTSVLYVLNSGAAQGYDAAIFANGASSPLRTIDIGKYSDGFTVDGSGRLYVGLPANEEYPKGPSLLNIYGNRGAKLLRTLHQKNAFGLLTVDNFGNLFTLCGGDRLCEYASAKQHIIRRIALRPLKSGASALAVDPSGDLAVDNIYGQVFVFAPGATQPYWVTQYGNDYSTALAFDASGSMYVANFGSNGGDPGNVSVYSPGAKTPRLVITNGIVEPNALAFDASGNLYVLNYCIYEHSGCLQHPAVTVYAPGASVPMLTITDEVEGLGDIAVDLAGNLYVANEGNARFSPPDPGSVSIYPPGASSPSQILTSGVANPTAISVVH